MDKQSNLFNTRKKIFWSSNIRYHDIAFAFEDTDRLLRANKTILALVSPVFESMFFKNIQTMEPVKIRGTDFETFKKLLDYIYTNEFKANSLDEAESLFSIARRFKITIQEGDCKTSIMKITKDNDRKEVKKFMEKYNLKHFEKIVQLLENHAPNTNIPAHWVKFKKTDPYPSGMIIVGNDEYGFPIGIGRYVHSMFGATLPGTFYTKDCAVEVSLDYMAYKNSEQFEVLCDGDVDWIEAKATITHPLSVEGGMMRSNQPSYIGKVMHEDKLVIGKIHTNNGMYIAWNGFEIPITENYYQLIDKNKKTENDEMLFSLSTSRKNLFDFFKRGRRYNKRDSSNGSSIGNGGSRVKFD